ncbi:MAG: carbamate kinase, partial [Levilactobacillus brevis]
ETVSVAELQEYLDQDQFAKGSMLPKVQAAINFVNNSEGGKAVVTSLENVGNFLKNGDGTIITK